LWAWFWWPDPGACDGLEAESLSEKTVLVALSGGVDSSVAAVLLHAEVMVITGTSFRAQGRLQLEQEVVIAQQAVS